MRREDALNFVESLTRMAGVTHACVSTGEDVISSAKQGEALNSDKAWLALRETFNLLEMHRMTCDRMQWMFDEKNILAVRTPDCVLGVVVDRAATKQVEAKISTLLGAKA